MAQESGISVFTSESDTVELAQRAIRAGLISREVLNQLISLNPQVPGSMKHRYLLACFYTKLQYFKKHCNNVPKEFSKFDVKAPTNPDACTPKEIPLGPEQLCNLNELLVSYAHKWWSIGLALRFQTQDLEKIQFSPLLLQFAPNSYLTKLLDDWLQMKLEHTLPPTVNNLKRALSSNTVDLGRLAKDVQAESLMSSDSLQRALSYSVAMVSISCTVAADGQFEYSHTSSNTTDFLRLEEGKSTLLEVQLDTTGLTEEHSFEYQWLIDDLPLDMDHQMQDRNKVSATCSSTTFPSLCFVKADLDMDECEFTCEIRIVDKSGGDSSVLSIPRTSLSLSDNLVKTTPVVLTVPCQLDKYKGSLASMYLAQPEVPDDTWPPPPGRQKYINLALIRQQKANYGSQYARFTIREDLDDILEHKQVVEYEEVYRSLKSGQLVLIEGQPGSGKTTFVHKIAKDWASRSGSAIRLLLLVSLRVLNKIVSPKLSDILNLFEDLNVSQELIEKRAGKGVCFVFDGLDEFAPPNRDQSIVYKIINKTYLNQSTVIVASRPVGIAKLRHRAHKLIEVLGFQNDQTFEYFDQYPFSKFSKPAELKAYLSFHPNILRMCCFPIHAAMVAYVFEVTGTVPGTETEMYKLFTRFTLMRNLSKSNEDSVNNIDVHSLTGGEKRCFERICHLAFTKTLVNTRVLRKKEISLFQFNDIDISLGLITTDSIADLNGYKDIHTFLHLTFQEYLAASYISTCKKEKQIELILEHGHKNHMLVAWKFFCGLLKIESYDTRFKSILQKTDGNFLFQIQCAYESQQQLACVQLLKHLNYHIKLTDERLSSFDFTAIDYVASFTIIPLKLSLINCDFDSGDAFSDQTMQYMQDLHVESESFDRQTLDCIKKLVTNFKSLERLFVKAKVKSTLDCPLVVNSKHCSIKDISIIQTDLLLLGYFPNLQILNLEGSITGDNGLKILADCLKSCVSLKELNVSDNDIGPEAAAVLANSVAQCRCLEKINISNNAIPVSGLEMILHSLRQHSIKVKADEITYQKMFRVSNVDFLTHLEQCHDLQSLDISFIDGVDSYCLGLKCRCWGNLKELKVVSESSPYLTDNIATISINIQHFRHLQALALKYFIDSTIGASNLMFSLLRCPNLQILDLSDNQIGPEEVNEIVNGLGSFSNLRELHLNNNHIGDKGVEALASCHYLQHGTLQELSVANNGITDGCMALAANLSHFTMLQKLELKQNSIGSDTARSLASGLQLCRRFQTISFSRSACIEAFELEITKNKPFTFDIIFV